MPGVEMLNHALQEVADRKRKQNSLKPLRVYLLIDERGSVANIGFNGKLGKKWPCTPESLGIYSAPGLVDVYPATFHHNSFGGNHAKTVIVDNKIMVITGANYQSSNFGHVPAHDASLLFQGPVAQSARFDFVEMWNSEKRREDQECPNLVQETIFHERSNNPNPRMVPVLFVSRKTQRLPTNDSYDNPLAQTYLTAIEYAQNVIKISTPNLNDPQIIDALVDFINQRGGTVEILLGKGFNDSREAMPGMGGTNQAAVDTLFRRVDSDKLSKLHVKWFSLDGEKPVLANVAGASHLKFMAIDGQVVIFGNANLDIISLATLHECNCVIDDAKTTASLTDAVFKPVYEMSVEAKPSENFQEEALEYLGVKGVREKLAPEYELTITHVDEESSGYRTIHFKRPEGWTFKPGQYLEVRSGRVLSEWLKDSAVVAIASGTNDKDIQITVRPSIKPWHPNRPLHRGADESLKVTGPIGTSFPLHLIQPSTNLLLIGGGSGLTPLRSVMRSLPDNAQAKLYYSAKTHKDLLYRDDVKEWLQNGHIISLTQEKADGFEKGRITDLLKDHTVQADSLVFICGPVELVKGVVKELVGKGVDRKQIYASLPLGAKEGGPVFRGDHPKLK